MGLKTALLVIAMYLTVAGAVGYGWLLNLVALVHAAQDGVLLNVVILLRVVGLFVVPFGSILGYLV
jgi:hypothetical protein